MMKVYIVTHKNYNFPQNEIYCPIQVNAGKNANLDIKIKDNIGENISNKNKNFCELTALYWIWKNSKEDIIGLVHYRRYFYRNTISKNYKNILGKKDIDNILKEYDIILPKKYYLYKNTVEQQYGSIHNAGDMLVCKEIIKEKYPQYIESFNRVMSQHYFFPYNMFIAKKEIIDKYCEWLFDILFELERKICIKEYDKYNQRVFGFMSERLFNVWLDKNKLRIKEIQVNNTEDNNIKESLKNMIKKFLFIFNIK